MSSNSLSTTSNKSNINNNTLHFISEKEFLMKKVEILEKDLFKSRTENKKLEKTNKKLENRLSQIGNNTNNTSVTFLLPSEFKLLWEKTMKDSLLEAFDNIISDYKLLSYIVKNLMRIIYENAKEIIKERINKVFSLFHIPNEKCVLTEILPKFRFLLQEYFTFIFQLDLDENTTDNVTRIVMDCIKQDYTYQYDISLLENDLKSEYYKEFIKDSFKISLYMLLHEPILSFDSTVSIEFTRFKKGVMTPIEGFIKDKSVCCVVLNPPLLKGKFIYQGILPVVYIIEDPDDDVILKISEESNKTKTQQYENENNEEIKKEIVNELDIDMDMEIDNEIENDLIINCYNGLKRTEVDEKKEIFRSNSNFRDNKNIEMNEKEVITNQTNQSTQSKLNYKSFVSSKSSLSNMKINHQMNSNLFKPRILEINQNKYSNQNYLINSNSNSALTALSGKYGSVNGNIGNLSNNGNNINNISSYMLNNTNTINSNTNTNTNPAIQKANLKKKKDSRNNFNKNMSQIEGNSPLRSNIHISSTHVRPLFKNDNEEVMTNDNCETVINKPQNQINPNPSSARDLPYTVNVNTNNKEIIKRKENQQVKSSITSSFISNHMYNLSQMPRKSSQRKEISRAGSSNTKKTIEDDALKGNNNKGISVSKSNIQYLVSGYMSHMSNISNNTNKNKNTLTSMKNDRKERFERSMITSKSKEPERFDYKNKNNYNKEVVHTDSNEKIVDLTQFAYKNNEKDKEKLGKYDFSIRPSLSKRNKSSYSKEKVEINDNVNSIDVGKNMKNNSIAMIRNKIEMYYNKINGSTNKFNN